jgi:hypothetical protein
MITAISQNKLGYCPPATNLPIWEKLYNTQKLGV